jgi:hypothetical protein
VVLGRFPRVMFGLQVMAMGQMSVMAGLLVIACFVVLGSRPVVLGGMFVMFRGLTVMFSALFRHGTLLATFWT